MCTLENLSDLEALDELKKRLTDSEILDELEELLAERGIRYTRSEHGLPTIYIQHHHLIHDCSIHDFDGRLHVTFSGSGCPFDIHSFVSLLTTPDSRG